jgi:hypothetical protein
MHVSGMTCRGCQTVVQGNFAETPLANLPIEHQRFIEMFVISSGSLKDIAAHAGVSYPTVRSRLDKVIAALRESMGKTQASGNGSADAEDPAVIIKNI